MPRSQTGRARTALTYQDNNTDNAGWTSFDQGSVGGPTINVAVDPVMGECGGTCANITVGDDIKIQNGNLMNAGANNFRSVSRRS